MSIFDIIVLAIAVASFFIGMHKGLISELAGLLGLVVGIYGAVKFSSYTEQALAEHVSFQGIGAVSFVITAAIIVVAMHFLSAVITKAIGMTLLSLPNKLLGGLFCAIKNLFILSCLICAANYFVGDVIELFSADEKAKSVTYEPLKNTAPYIFPYLDFGVSQIKDAVNNAEIK